MHILHPTQMERKTERGGYKRDVETDWNFAGGRGGGC
jgi:hypothetical protein